MAPCFDTLIDWVCFRLFSEPSCINQSINRIKARSHLSNEPLHQTQWDIDAKPQRVNQTTRNESMDQCIRNHEAMHQSISVSESVDRWITMSLKRDSMHQRRKTSSWSTQSTSGAIKLCQNQRANRSSWSNGATSMDQWFMNQCLCIICYMNQRRVTELMHQLIQERMSHCIETNYAINRSATAPESMHQCISEAESMYQWIINEWLLQWVMETTHPRWLVGGGPVVSWPQWLVARFVGVRIYQAMNQWMNSPIGQRLNEEDQETIEAIPISMWFHNLLLGSAAAELILRKKAVPATYSSFSYSCMLLNGAGGVHLYVWYAMITYDITPYHTALLSRYIANTSNTSPYIHTVQYSIWRRPVWWRCGTLW